MDLEDVPPFTTLWAGGALILALLEKFGFISEHQIFYSSYYVFVKREYWRFVTSFMYFGSLDVLFLFKMLFNMRYAYILESQTYGASRRADYAWLLLTSSLVILLSSSLLTMRFLSEPLSWVILYLWCRKNRHLRLNFFGIIVFSASYLPLIELFRELLNGSLEIKEMLVGITIGHICAWISCIFLTQTTMCKNSCPKS